MDNVDSKMLMLSFVLLPVVFRATVESPVNEYVIKIKENTLTSVEATKTSSAELNLSGYGLRRIEDDALKNLVNLKILKLDNNSLYELPQFLFSNLTNLQHLSLVNNSLDRFANVFVGLDNLKTLNISYNLVKSFEPGDFYGLSSHVNIHTLGNPLERICTSLFEKEQPRTSGWIPFALVKREILNDDGSRFRAKVCIRQGIVSRLENLEGGETVPSGCREVGTKQSNGTIKLFLDNLGITGFEAGWYSIKATSKQNIVLSLLKNNIARVGKEMLNDLPSSVSFVNLAGNKIDHLDNEVIVNAHLAELNLTNNRITKIGEGALQKTNITRLYLDMNELRTTTFMSDLPSSIETVRATKNRIGSLSENPIPKLDNLQFFYLDSNRITIVRRTSLRELKSLRHLSLSDNRITTIEPGCFSDLQSLKYLNLRNNRITNIESGIFEGTGNLRFVDLGSNRLKKIQANTMPQNLLSLLLDHNTIEDLEAGSFANMPLNQISLAGNNVSVIPKGTFNVPNQHWVRDVDQFKVLMGLQQLFRISFFNTFVASGEKTLQLAESLSHVDLSNNPIKRLENGAMFGIRKHRSNWIYVSQSPIELIQGGLFDDV